MLKTRHVGIMGGTFNPIHYSHLILAVNAYEQYHLDEVWMMPSGDPPHKAKDAILPKNHRLSMVSLAIEGTPAFKLSTFETDRTGYSYSAETLTLLEEKNPDTQYYFIMGADSLFQIESWKEPSIVMEKAILIVAIRDQRSKEEMEEQINYLEKKYHARILTLSVPDIDISSKMIRNRVKSHQTIKYFLPEKVENYIYEHQLYQ